MGFFEAGDGVSRDEVEAELRLVLGDREFLKNSNSAKFLKFIVDETLEGRGSRLKAYTIATLALDREANFDPQTNSIVRVQAMRLRELLDGYYSRAGASDPLRIVLRRGAYQPGFERRARPEDLVRSPEPDEAGELVLVAEPPARRALGRPFSRRTVATLLGSTVAGLSLLAWILWTALARSSTSPWPAAVGGPFDGPPSVVVNAPEIVAGSAQTARFSARLFHAIEEGLSNFDYITVRSSTFRGLPPTEAGYVLSGQFLDSGNGRSDVAIQLVREPAGDVVWSHHYDDVNGDDRNAIDGLARFLVSDLADPRGGAIFADVRDQIRTAKAPLRGYACLIGGVEFVVSREEEERAKERKCLESEIEANPDNVGALTLLSTVLILSYLEVAPDSGGTSDLQRASRLARRAIELAPQRATALDALFFSRFVDKRFDEAFAGARQALSANPNSSLFAERIASAYMARGSYGEGLALVGPFLATALGPPAGSLPFLAIAAHMRGDAKAMFDYTRRMGMAVTPLGLVMRIIACNEREDARCVAASSDQLRDQFPGFARNVGDALDRWAIVDGVKAALLSDLAAAGFEATTADR